VADGGRVITVDPERLAGWLERFAGRHGAVRVEAGPDEVAYAAADGAVARVQVPFPPLAVDPAAVDGGLVAHALAVRRVGVVLVRLGGHAAGVFDGAELVASKVGQRPVHGRSAAGGWSQHRFARRREGQAKVALAAAADVVVATVLPAAGELDAVVLGGDRRAVESVLTDPRLAPLRRLVVEQRLDVPDPRRKILLETPKLFRAVRIRLTEPVVTDRE
jgi:Actinobacteria/chloroflexi VLRF1 release factor